MKTVYIDGIKYKIHSYNPHVFLYDKLHWKRKKKIYEENEEMIDYLVAAAFNEAIVLFDCTDINEDNITDLMDHEFLHHILLRLEGFEACTCLDNLEDMNHRLKDFTNFPIDGSIRNEL